MLNKLADKVVFITGASSGFGADTARLFAKEGCIVILTARRMDRLTSLEKQICDEGGQALVLNLDITNQSQIEAAVTNVLERYGRIDILFNNAGFGRIDWLETLEPAADINAQIDVNLRGLIQMTRAVIPSMLANRAGTIINMSSVAGMIAAPMYSIYGATKYGVRGFTESLRRELAPFNIHVCGIYPGPANTEFSEHTGSKNAFKENIRPPKWLYMSSSHVAKKTITLAKHPRRAMVFQWWFGPIIVFNSIFPGLVDWFLKLAFVKRFHKAS
jgi:short-subunit dehydrogenase